MRIEILEIGEHLERTWLFVNGTPEILYIPNGRDKKEIRLLFDYLFSKCLAEIRAAGFDMAKIEEKLADMDNIEPLVNIAKDIGITIQVENPQKFIVTRPF